MTLTAYTVTATRGCRVIDRPVPISEFCALVRAWEELQDPGDEWICDALLSSRLGVAFVVGPKSATQAWRDELGITPPTEPTNHE